MVNEGESNETKGELSKLEWIELRNDIEVAGQVHTESSSDKFMRKFKENPLVPIGKFQPLVNVLVSFTSH